MKNILTRALIAGAAVASSVALVAGMQPATGSTGTVATDAISVSATSVEVGSSFTVTGKMEKKGVRSVQVMTVVSGKWTMIGEAKTSKRGDFSVSLKAPAAPGNLRLMGWAPKAGKKFPEVYTNSVLVKVLAPTKPVTSGAVAPVPPPAPGPRPVPNVVPNATPKPVVK